MCSGGGGRGNVLDDAKREVELFGRGNVRDAYV